MRYRCTPSANARTTACERDQDLARLADLVLLQPPGAGYPPFKSTLRADTVAAALRRPDIVAGESTPLLFLVIRAIGERRLAIPSHILAETLALSLGGGALGALAAVPTAYAFGWTWILTGGEPRPQHLRLERRP